jgi:hypothetical protein
MVPMYHIELRKFPHNQCRFNLTEDELSRLVVPWVQGQWVRVGERNWNAHQARLTIFEGPRLASGDLTMGRGWRTAQRHGTDVTRQLLERARDAHVAAAGGSNRQSVAKDARGEQPPPDDLAPREKSADVGGPPRDELLTLLGAAPEPLLAAWRRAAARMPERRPSESLAVAEEELASLQAQEGGASSG